MKLVRNLLLMIFGLMLGIGLTITTPTVETTFASAKRNLRIALDLEKFWTPVNVDDDGGRTEVECPDPDATKVIVTGGQSNASNALSGPPAGPDERVLTWFDGACYIAEEPVLGATGSRTSLWLPLGHKLADTLGKKVLFINSAVGGSQFSDWLDERSGYLNALINRVEGARAHGFEPTWIIWHQGETDAAILSERTEEELRGLIDRLTGEMPKARLYLFQASKCIGSNRENGVAKMINLERRVALSTRNVIVGMNTDELGDDFRYDRCHFNSRGKSSIVDRLARDISVSERMKTQ